MMQGDLIRHYGEHMVTAKVGAAPCGPALPERARRLGCFLPRSWGGGAASGVSWLPEERVALLSMSVVLPGMGKHSCCWEGPGTWVSLLSV